jgi:hypothetical protein
MRPVAAAPAGLATSSLLAASGAMGPMPRSLRLASVAQLVAQGCSRGWRHGLWQDLSGESHWVPVSQAGVDYSTVTDFARLRGLSMSQPFFSAT